LPGDVEQFEARAQRYDQSTLGRRFHLPVQEAVLGIAARLAPRPEAILDVGCGTGSLLRLAADRFPTARLYGVDPAEAMWPSRPPIRGSPLPAPRPSGCRSPMRAST